MTAFRKEDLTHARFERLSLSPSAPNAT